MSLAIPVEASYEARSPVISVQCPGTEGQKKSFGWLEPDHLSKPLKAVSENCEMGTDAVIFQAHSLFERSLIRISEFLKVIVF